MNGKHDNVDLDLSHGNHRLHVEMAWWVQQMWMAVWVLGIMHYHQEVFVVHSVRILDHWIQESSVVVLTRSHNKLIRH
jgi:hypothetical protein